MWHVRSFDPISRRKEDILLLPDLTQKDAAARTREYLLATGLRHGILSENDSPAEHVVYGFREKATTAMKRGGYMFAPTNDTFFEFRYLKRELDLKINSFIDLGCGPGNVLLTAADVFSPARLVGVELDAGLAREARGFTAPLNAEIITADLLGWAPAQNDFDMVFIYDPIHQPDLRRRFFAFLRTWLKTGQPVFFRAAAPELPEWLIPVWRDRLFTAA